MQKHQIFYLSLIATVFTYPDFADAGIQSLPRYQGGYSARSQGGGKDNVSVSCASKGGVEKGANQTCTGAFSAGGKICYKTCHCIDGYRKSGSSCVAKTCSDYGYQYNNDTSKDCSPRYPRSGLTCYECSSCDSSYKYSCSGSLNASTQYNQQCGYKYAQCSCVANASWNSSAARCECNGDYKESYGSCVPKTCEDYGYQSDNDTDKDCSARYPRSGLTCYSCESCGSSYQYNCSAITNANGGDGTACGGKYAKCKCKTNYFWDNGTCSLSCTPCSSAEYPLSSKNVTKASAYETCSCNGVTKYKVTACEGDYAPTANGNGCSLTCTPCSSYQYPLNSKSASRATAYDTCNCNGVTRYRVTACETGYSASSSGTSCQLTCLYNATSCSKGYEITDSCEKNGQTYYRCESCTRSGGTADGYKTCSGTGTPTGELECNGKTFYSDCGCSGYDASLYTCPTGTITTFEQSFNGNRCDAVISSNDEACYENGILKTINGCYSYVCASDQPFQCDPNAHFEDSAASFIGKICVNSSSPSGGFLPAVLPPLAK